MKKTTLFAAIALTFTASASQAVVLNFTNSTTAAIAGSDFNFAACGDIDFNAGAEYRMCDPTRKQLGGGYPLQKDTIRGDESWEFNLTGEMTTVNNTATTTGLTRYETAGSGISGPAIDKGSFFKGNLFAFLAPTLGSEAGDFYDAAIYTATGENTFEIFFSVLEGQWAGAFFPLGTFDGDGDGVGDGVTFYGTVSDVTSASANFTLWAEHTFDTSEDPDGAGFAGWTAQWYYTGAIDDFVPPSAVPVPAAVWLFGSGILALAGVARRRKTL